MLAFYFYCKGISVVLLVQSVNSITFGAEGAGFDTHYHPFFPDEFYGFSFFLKPNNLINMKKVH